MNYCKIKTGFYIICSILLFLWANIAKAQKAQILFDAYTVDDGLSQNSVNSIFKDSRGFIWIGTEDGLNRYDGVTFKTFRPDIKNRFSIANNYIYSIIELPTGDLLLGTEKGLSVFHYHQQHFYNYYLLKDQEICVRTLHLDKAGNIWIGTRNKGLFKYDINKLSLIHINGTLTYNLQFACSQVHDIKQNKENTIWFATDNGVFSYDFKSDSFKALLLQSNNKSTEIFSLHFLNTNALLIGTNSGCYNYDIVTQNCKRYDFGHPLRNNIRALVSDNQKNIWLATDKGLILLNSITSEYEIFINEVNAPLSLRQNIVLAL